MGKIEVVTEIKEVGENTVLVVRLPQKMKMLSTTVLNGGFSMSDTILSVQVPIHYNGTEPESEIVEICSTLGLCAGSVGFMTAVDLKKVLTIVSEEYHGINVTVVATSGVKNAVYAGELMPDALVRGLNGPGTINIIVALDRPLHEVGMANSLITITEAKTAALMDTKTRGTGTTSDAIAICCPEGDGEKYAGTATDVGICMARAVRKAVAASTLKWYARPGPVDFIKLLEDRGITMEEMWTAANKLVFPNPDWPEGFLKGKFVERMNLLRQDVNVNAMVKGAILLEDAGKAQDLYGLDNGIFDSDPVHLLADELMGIALAEYIAGTKGLFEYVRYDRKKPGILAELGPFLDDIVGALIGAVMSRIYSDLLEAEGRLQ
ncbi:MAG: phosphatidylglycerophosphatase A [Methanomassiliicoccales archaeon]